MKSIPGLLVPLVALFAASSALFAAPIPDHDAAGVPREVQNLLTNGDFEISTQTADWPDDWGRPQQGLAEWKAREDNAHYVVLKATAAGQSIMIYRAMPLPAGVEAIEVTIKARVTGLKRGQQLWHDARVMLELKDAQFKVMKPSPKPIAFNRDTGDWVTKSVTFQVPAGAKTLEIMPSLFQVTEGSFELEYVLVAPVRPAAGGLAR